MWKLATAFAEVALRRRGPESLPDSTFLVVLLLVVHFALTLALLPLDPAFSRADLLVYGVNVLLYLAFTYAVLAFFRLERRYRRTLSALLGADICISALFFPLILLALGFGLDPYAPPFFWAGLALQLWAVFISAWILARSLSQPLPVGLMFEILYILTTYYIRLVLLPPTVTVTTTTA